jgi:hypothetical protein
VHSSLHMGARESSLCCISMLLVKFCVKGLVLYVHTIVWRSDALLASHCMRAFAGHQKQLCARSGSRIRQCGSRASSALIACQQPRCKRGVGWITVAGS